MTANLVYAALRFLSAGPGRYSVNAVRRAATARCGCPQDR